ncbi:MAG: SAM-dependent methyltransferase [Planctomycetota bacterium]|jgi:hypothetical protein
MKKLGFSLTFLAVVVCSLFPGGCDRREEQQDLEASAKAELAAVIQDRNKLQEQVGKLARDWATKEKSTQTTIENLKNQLAEHREKVVDLQDRNEKLQATIDELLKKFGVKAKEVKGEFKEIREPDVIFVPTPQDVVDKMLELAEVKKEDLVYDLGCGDGRIVVTVAKRFGCKAKGYDIAEGHLHPRPQQGKRNHSLPASGTECEADTAVGEAQARLADSLTRLRNERSQAGQGRYTYF